MIWYSAYVDKKLNLYILKLFKSDEDDEPYRTTHYPMQDLNIFLGDVTILKNAGANRTHHERRDA